MNRRIVAALVVVLLAVSCTPDQPDQIATGVAGKDPVDPQLRAQRPADKISTRLQYYCEPSWRCGIRHVERLPRKTEALVGQLLQDKPSWLRYIKAIEIRSSFPQNEAERDRQVQVQTGILANEAGKDLGAAICLALLEKKLDDGFVWGVSRSLPAPTPRASWDTRLLAECQ
jgi:hypothetical protein